MASLGNVSGDDFEAASERMRACMETAGFRTDGDGVVLKDGTRFERPEFGQPLEMNYAVAEYLSASARCQAESGFDDVLRRAGVADELPDPVLVQRDNELIVAKVACLEARGWTFREFVRMFGGLLYTEPILEPGDQDAYAIDEAECAAEAGTS